MQTIVVLVMGSPLTDKSRLIKVMKEAAIKEINRTNMQIGINFKQIQLPKGS